MAGTSQVDGGSDYGSDFLTELGSEIFYSITSKVSQKSIPIAGCTRNIETRRGERPKESPGNSLVCNQPTI